MAAASRALTLAASNWPTQAEVLLMHFLPRDVMDEHGSHRKQGGRKTDGRTKAREEGRKE